MDELIMAMSNDDLKALMKKYSDNQSIVTLIDGILQTRQQEQAQAKAKSQFTNGIAKLFAKLPHPEDIHNVNVRWGEAEVEQGEPEEVEVVTTPAVTDEEGRIATPAVMSTEMRVPKVKVYKWIVEVNKALPVQKVATSQSVTSKRGISVYKREGLTLVLKGRFTSASKACSALGLTIGGDSAVRVLARDNYITEPYDGTDYES